jgi:glycerol dehydrogenase
MVRIMVAPGRYVQAPRGLDEAGTYIRSLGSRVFFVADSFAWSLVGDRILASARQSGLESHFDAFSGTCTQNEADRLSEKARAFAADVVVGVGGGSALDAAKAVSHQIGSNLVTAPTVASNDAPCSALAVMYGENHKITGFLKLRRNPDLVLVDSKVIAEAPVRFLVAGMGDAMATWFEAETCAKLSGKNVHDGLSTSAALALARLCHDILVEYGASAKLAVEAKALTPAVEKVIEANILLSGLGFESGGLAAAHAIQDGLHELPGTQDVLHGEMVAFGTMAQLVLENYPRADIDRTIAFFNAVGLPVSLQQAGLPGISREQLRKAAEVAHARGLKATFPADVDDILGAIIGADALGREALQKTCRERVA